MRTTSTLILLSFFLLFSRATSFNITRILDAYPEFQTFNNYLNQTKVNLNINSRSTITVLAVDNGAMGAISGSNVETLKWIMSLHVILDYYDKDKLMDLPKDNATEITTLFQSTGEAMRSQGFLRIYREKGGGFLIGSSVNGAQPNARFVREVAAQPYNISVMQISNPVYVPGVQNNSQSTPVSPPPPAAKAPSPKSDDTPASPPEADAPAADSPAADAPTADHAPASGPSPSPTADGPAADAPESDAADGPGASKEVDSNVGARTSVGASVGAFVVAVSSWVVLLL